MLPPNLDEFLRANSKDERSAHRLRVLVESMMHAAAPPVPLSATAFVPALNRIVGELLRGLPDADILRTIAETTAEVLDAAFSEVLLRDGDDLVVCATNRSAGASLVGERVTREVAVLSWMAYDTCQPIVIEDYTTWSLRRSVYDSYPLYAVAEIPVIALDTCLGVLALGRSTPNTPFTPQDMQHAAVFAQLVALVMISQRQIDSARREADEHKRTQWAALRFQQDLKTLHSINLELMVQPTLDALCRSVVEVAKARLNIDRVSLFLVENGVLVGTYGTDGRGALRDERDYKEELTPDHWTRHIDESPERAAFWRDAALYDNGQIVGQGWKAAAALWDGERTIGYLVIDNHVSRRQPSLYESELLSLYGITVGHLITIKRTEEARERLDERLRVIAKNLREVIVQISPDGVIQYVGPSVMEALGHEPDALHGKHWIEFVHPEDQERIAAAFERMIEQSSDDDALVELRVCHANGQMIWMEASGRTVLDKTGEVNRVITVLRSIGERRALQAARLQEETLRVALQKETELNEMKNRMMVRIAHEFRTPLAVILTSADILERYAQRLSEEERAVRFDRIRGGVHRVTRILDDILVLMRKQMGQIPLAISTVHLQEVVRLAVRAVEVDFEGRAIAVSMDDVELTTDPAMLHTALMNVLSNALKFSPVDAPVNVSAQVSEDQIVMCVCDRGIGIPEAEIARVFEPFFRASNIGEVEGIGLGLSIVKDALEMLGGRVTVESHEGTGTSVSLILPRTFTFPADG